MDIRSLLGGFMWDGVGMDATGHLADLKFFLEGLGKEWHFKDSAAVPQNSGLHESICNLFYMEAITILCS